MAGTRNYDFLVGRPYTRSFAFVPVDANFPTDKAPPHWRFWGWKIMLFAPIQRGFFYTVIHHDHRH